MPPPDPQRRHFRDAMGLLSRQFNRLNRGKQMNAKADLTHAVGVERRLLGARGGVVQPVELRHVKAPCSTWRADFAIFWSCAYWD